MPTAIRLRRSQGVLSALGVLLVGTLGVSALSASAGAAAESVTTGEVARSAPEVLAQATARESGSRVEIVAKRTENSSTYANGDGTETTEITGNPMWVESDASTTGWVPADETLRFSDGEVTPTASTLEVSLSDGGSREIARTTFADGSFLAVTWPDPLPRPVLDGAIATYTVDSSTDLVIGLTGSGFRTHIVLKDEPVGNVESFVLGIKTSEVNVVQAGNGLALLNGEGAKIGQSSSLTAWDSSVDAAGDPVEQVPLDAELATASRGTSTAKQELSLTAPAGFLTDEDTQYPVVIDPDIQSLTLLRDAYVQSGEFASTNYSASHSLRVGSNNGTTQTVSLIKFHSGSALNPAVAVTNANLRLWQYYAPGCSPKSMSVAGLSESFSSSVTWNTRPTATPTHAVTSSFNANYGSSCGGASQNIDVTEIAQDWAADTLTNEGLRLYVPSANALDEAYDKRFCSADPDTSHSSCYTGNRSPKLIVTYVPAPGETTDTTVDPKLSEGVNLVTPPMPMIGAKIFSPGVSSLTFRAEIWTAPTGGQQVSSCQTPGVQVNEFGSCTPQTLLSNSTIYYARTRVSSPTKVGPWSGFTAFKTMAPVAGGTLTDSSNVSGPNLVGGSLLKADGSAAPAGTQMWLILQPSAAKMENAEIGELVQMQTIAAATVGSNGRFDFKVAEEAALDRVAETATSADVIIKAESSQVSAIYSGTLQLRTESSLPAGVARAKFFSNELSSDDIRPSADDIVIRSSEVGASGAGDILDNIEDVNTIEGIDYGTTPIPAASAWEAGEGPVEDEPDPVAEPVALDPVTGIPVLHASTPKKQEPWESRPGVNCGERKLYKWKPSTILGAAYKQTNDAVVSFKYNLAAKSKLGFAASTGSGEYGSFKADGTREISNSSSLGFTVPSGKNNSSFITKSKYAKYHFQCFTPTWQYAWADDYTSHAYAISGGRTFGYAGATPNVDSDNCDYYEADASSAHTESSTASTFKKGVKTGSALGIDLSAQTSYTNVARVTVKNPSKAVWICGTAGGLLEKKVGQVVVRDGTYWAN